MPSQEMIEQLKKPYRNMGFLKIEFNIIDPETNPTITASDEEVFSDLQKIREEKIVQEKNYATLEKNFWLLDDSQPIYGSEELEQTYVSSKVSNEDCTFEEPPKFIIESSKFLTTLGLTMIFDSINKNYAKKINIKAYQNEELVINKNYVVTDYKDRVILADSEELFRWNKMEIIFLETSLPFRRIKLNQLIFGILEVYADKTIINAESKEKTTMINSELPTHTFKFTIDNSKKLFNPDNPVGWYRYILQQQPISYTWGYQLDSGEIEWLLGGKMLLTGNVSVSDNKATFNTSTLINYLNKPYKKGVYSLNGRSLYDLAEDVLSYNKIEPSQYNLWIGLKNIKTNAALPKLESRQLLQIIASAGNCTLFTNRENIINIQPLNSLVNANGMKYDFITNTPKITVQTELYNSIVYLYHYYVDSNISEIFKNDKLELSDTIVLEIEYDLAINVSATVTNATILSAEYYGRYALLEIEPTDITQPVSLSLNGNKILNSQTLDIKNYNVMGENVEYKNELITPMLENCKTVKTKEFTGSWYNQRNIYTFENRGDITKDTRELIPIETDFTNNLVGYLVENNIKYDGAWSGNSTVIKVGEQNVD